MDGPKLFRPMAQNNQCRVVIDFHTDLACDHQVGIHLQIRIQHRQKVWDPETRNATFFYELFKIVYFSA
jgi:hypothetical protein